MNRFVNDQALFRALFSIIFFVNVMSLDCNLSITNCQVGDLLSAIMSSRFELLYSSHHKKAFYKLEKRHRIRKINRDILCSWRLLPNSIQWQLSAMVLLVCLSAGPVSLPWFTLTFGEWWCELRYWHTWGFAQNLPR